MAIIIDEELVKKGICTCHQINKTEEPEDLICFSQGAIGALSKKQIRELCKTKTIQKEDAIRERVQKFREASDVCEIETEKYPKGEKLIPRLRCMSVELKKRGIEIQYIKIQNKRRNKTKV